MKPQPLDLEELRDLEKTIKKEFKKELKYPEKWDTIAYPTIFHALWELFCWQKAELDNLKQQELGV